jgi:RNA polymerase sigma-70 factor (ECF subfamily)
MLTLTDETRRADEEALLVAVRGGSLDALGALYTRHAEAVYRLAYRITGSAADAEDVLQDVFVGLPGALQGYAERGQFAAWLKRVAARTALMRLRGQARRREAAIDTAVEVLPAAAAADPVDRVAVQRALARIPAPLRLVFHLKEVEGYSHAEIAELLGITSGASAVRLSRAWKLLRHEAWTR